MALYFVDYDLRGQRDYQKLYDELAKFKAIRMLESLWCLQHGSTSCAALRDHFSKFIDGNDGLCVSRVAGWATIGIPTTPKNLRATAPKSSLAKLAAMAAKKPPR